MRAWILALAAIVVGFTQPAYAIDIPLVASNWSVFAGTGSLSNVTEAVPGLGSVSVLKSQTTNGINFGFIQNNYQSLVQSGRYVRAQVKTNGNFILYVRARGTNGLDYYLTYSSYLQQSYADANRYLYFTLSADYPNRYNQYVTYTLDVQRDIERMLPGVSLSYIRWIAVRGYMNLGQLSLLDTVDYLAADDDGDLLLGSAEDALGTNPFLRDTDGDGLADGLEASNPCGNALNPAVPSNLDTDPDGDGLTTRTEMFLGSNCASAGATTLPTGYGWVAYYPQRIPPAGTMAVGGDGALVLNHVDPNPIRFGVYSPEPYGPLRLPNYLQAVRSTIRFQAKSAEMFYVFVRVVGSDNQQYYLAYSPDAAPPSSGGGYFYYPLGSLGYSFNGSSYTQVGRSLSDDLSNMLPGVTVQKILWVCVRGRLSINDIGFEDNAGPVISNLAAAPSPLGLGQTATITFDVNESLPGQPVVTVAGNAATYVSDDGVSYTFSYTTSGAEPEGSVPVAVQVTDGAGNPGTASSSISLDLTNPVFSAISVSKDPAKSGDEIIITFDSSEALAANPAVTVGGASAFFVALTGATYTYARVIDGTELGGMFTSVAVSGVDLAGNNGSGSIFMELDFVAPSFSNLNPAFPIGTTGSTVIFSVDESEVLAATPTATVGLIGTATHLGSVGATHTFSFSLWGGDPEGGHPIFVSGSDPAGNLGGTNVGSLLVDYHPPIINPAAVSPTSATMGNTVTITFTVGEAVPALPEVKVDGFDATLVSQVGNSYTFTYTLTGAEGNGVLPVLILARDTAGNVGWRGLPLTIDAPPFVAMTAPNDAAAGVTVTTKIRVQFNEPINPATVHAGTFLIAGGPAVGAITYDAPTRIAQFTLTGGNTLGYDLNYTVTLTAGIQDLAGNPLQNPYTFTFRTIAMGMASISGTLQVPPTWTQTKVVESTGGYLGTISGGAYTINVDKRANNVVFAWNDVNGDGVHQPGLEDRLFAFDCDAGSQLYDTTVANVANANIAFRTLTGSFVTPGAWQPQIFEDRTGNRATLGAEAFSLVVDLASERHIYIYDDANADQLWQPGENRIVNVNDPFNTCFLGFVMPLQFGIRSISGRVTEPVLPLVLNRIAAGTNAEGPYSYAPISGGLRDYTVYADTGWGATYVYAFGDSNANGLMDAGETRIPVSANPVNLIYGDVQNAYIFRRQISGTVAAAPPGWVRPRVGDAPEGNAVDVAPTGGPYAIYVPARPNIRLSWYDDRNNNYRIDAGENRLQYPYPLSTITSDLTGVNFTSACVLQGSVSVPAGWGAAYAYAEASTYNSAVSSPVSGGFYAVAVPPQTNQIRLLVFEDTNKNGLFDGAVDRHFLHEANYVNNVNTCVKTVNFVTTRSISGTVAAPAGWINPSVRVMSTPALDYGLNTGQVSGGVYTVRTTQSNSNTVTLFDDRNANKILDTFEPSFDYRLTVSTTFGNGVANFVLRTISGQAVAPIDALNPKVMAASNQWTATGGGAYSLQVNDRAHYVIFWDDANNNNRFDYGVEPLYGQAGTDTTTGNVVLNFNLRTIEGHVTPPPTWTNVLIDIDNTQTFGVSPENKYVAYVVDGAHWVRMFEDLNGNGRYDWPEPSVGYLYNSVNVAGGSVLGVNLDHPVISGNAQIPPTFVNPMVGTVFGGDGVRPVVPDGAGNFVLPAAYGFLQPAVFDDRNANGMYEFGEPIIRSLTPVIANGDVSGVSIIYRTIRGSVAFPPSWARPRVYEGSAWPPIDGVVTAGNYEIYVEPSAWGQVGMYDDLALKGEFFWGDPAIKWPTPIDTTAGDVNNINLYYRTISGSLVGGAGNGMLNPVAGAVGTTLGYGTRPSAGAYLVDVSPWDGPYTVVMWDDMTLNWQKETFEPGFVHNDGVTCPFQIDVAPGDATGIDIDTACGF